MWRKNCMTITIYLFLHSAFLRSQLLTDWNFVVLFAGYLPLSDHRLLLGVIAVDDVLLSWTSATQHTIDSSNPDTPHKLPSDILLFYLGNTFLLAHYKPCWKGLHRKNIASVLLDAHTTNRLCFTAILICTLREYAKLGRTLYVLAEEDVWNSD